jgi:hypothetical protein
MSVKQDMLVKTVKIVRRVIQATTAQSVTIDGSHGIILRHYFQTTLQKMADTSVTNVFQIISAITVQDVPMVQMYHSKQLEKITH